MRKSVASIKDIVTVGGSVILDANEYTTLALKEIAVICKSRDSKLILKNAKVKCNDSEIQISGKELDLLEQLLLRKAKAIYFRCFTRKLIKFG